MVARGHLCGEDWKEGNPAREEETQSNAAERPMQQSRSNRPQKNVTVPSEKWESSGEKQSEAGRSTHHEEGGKVGSTSFTTAQRKLPRLCSTAKGWQCLWRKWVGPERVMDLATIWVARLMSREGYESECPNLWVYRVTEAASADMERTRGKHLFHSEQGR